MKKFALFTLILAVTALAIYYFYPGDHLPEHCVIDKLVVVKSKRVMFAYADNRMVKTYHVALGRNPVGDKVFEGDKRTPEGRYFINDKNPDSGYHKNLGISYPNSDDLAEAKERNVLAGGSIKIHGLKNGRGYIGKFHRFRNWTAGCIAVTNEEIDELYAHVRMGAVIEIRP